MIQRIEANLHTNWQKEFANSVTEPNELLELLELNKETYIEDIKARSLFAMRVPRPFIAKMEKGNPNDPLLLQVLPLKQEFELHPEFSKDPLTEQETPVKGLLHKYKSRVLLIFKAGCAVNCRYCFRRHFPYGDNHLNKVQLRETLSYIQAHPEINEVILSGGDPLMAKDDALLWFVEQLEAIKHVTRLRIHTRLPVVIPSRITNELCALFANTRLNIVFVTHINHANEIDQTLVDAMAKLKHAGVTLLNQAVLLKDVNNHVIAQVNLSERLFDAGILPYYLHVLDKVEGAQHFYVSDNDAIALHSELLTELPGFLVPKLVREIGGEKSKTPIDLGLYSGSSVTAN